MPEVARTVNADGQTPARHTTPHRLSVAWGKKMSDRRHPPQGQDSGDRILLQFLAVTYQAPQKIGQLLREGRTRHDRVTPGGPGGGNELFLDVRCKPHNANRAGCGVSFERSNPIYGRQSAEIEVHNDGLRLGLSNGRRAAPPVARNHCYAKNFRGFPNFCQKEEVIHQSHDRRCHVIAIPGGVDSRR